MGRHSKRSSTRPRRILYAASSIAAAISAIPAVAHAVPAPTSALPPVDVDAINTAISHGVEQMTGIPHNPDITSQVHGAIGDITTAVNQAGAALSQGNIPDMSAVDSYIPPSMRQFFPAPGTSPTLPTPVGQRIVDAARSQIGTPYAYGGSHPGGFDCSGLTSWAYSQVGKNIPRTSDAQAAQGQEVSTPQLGDIVAFYNASHVGIFSGNGNVIHSPQAGDVVKEAPMNYMPVYSIVRF